MRIRTLCTFVTGPGEERPPGSVLDFPEDEALSLIARGSAVRWTPADGEPPAPSPASAAAPQTEGKKKKGAKAKEPAAAPAPDLDEDAVASAMMDLAEDTDSLDEEGRPSLEALEKLGYSISIEQRDRIWASLEG